jgi:hypothetical protein
MSTRHRTRVLTATSAGTFDLWWPPYSTTAPIQSSSGAAGITRFKESDDVVSAPPYTALNPLSLVEYSCEPLMRINGTIFDGTFESRFTRWNPTNRSLYQYCPVLTPVNWLYWSTKALANLNPAKPDVNLPNFLWELRDFPELLKNLGDVLSRRIHPRSIPEGYLAYSFGWAPLVNDLKSLFNLTKSIDDRIRYLRNLERGMHIRRKLGNVVIQHSIASNGYNVGYTFGGTNIMTADVDYTEKLKVWFTAQAKLRYPLSPASDLRSLSARQLLGLNGNPANVWDSIPWSWLIDYFFNVSDVIGATQGWIPFDVPSMCIMARGEASSKLTNVRLAPGLSVDGPCQLTTVGKQRYVTYEPIPWLTYKPFLTIGQYANLGSLVVARGLKSKGFGGAK